MKAEIIALKRPDEKEIKIYDSDIRIRGMKILIESTGNYETDKIIMGLVQKMLVRVQFER